MLEHILVPLDGSHMAELALPTTALLAQKLRSPWFISLRKIRR